MKRIDRKRYLDRLISRKSNGMIKVITGVRRSGKTFLLFNLFKDHLLQSGVNEDHIISIALDSKENESMRNPENLYREIIDRTGNDGEYYVILDEIQMTDDFESVMNSLLHRDNLDVYITGSNSKFLSSDIITEFRGRGDEIMVRPLSFSEFVSAYDGSAMDALNEYMDYGGLPELLSFRNDEQKASYLKSIMETTYLLDIKERNVIRLPQVLDNLVDVLSSSVGSMVNTRKIRDTMLTAGNRSVDDDTLSKYLGYLEDAFIFEKAERYDVKGRKYITSTKKYYSVDQGLTNARLNFRQIMDRPHIMENIIFNELRSRGYDVDVGEVRYSKVKDNSSIVIRSEVDFIARKGSRQYYIQSVYRMDDDAKYEQESRPLLKINDMFRKIIITGDEIKSHFDDNGIMHLGLIEFLMDPDSLEHDSRL